MKRISKNKTFVRRLFQLSSRSKCPIALLVSMIAASSAQAADSNQTGHITRVSYSTSGVLIMLDVGPPTNCAGTPFGWMMIAPPYTAMISFVTGLWFRGDAAAKQLAIYTSGIDGTGYCQISQIDTESAG